MEDADPDRGETFGQRVRRSRATIHLTQRDLAERLGIDFTYLSKIENDRGDPPAEAIVKKLATVLGADEEELLALAAKIPPSLRARASRDLRFARLLRRLPQASESDLRGLYSRLGIEEDKS